MYIADMHCDSLSLVSGERGLLNEYNFSNKNPQLQFFAHFSKSCGTSPEARRKRLIEALNIYLYECERNDIINVRSDKELFEATDYGARAGMFTVEGGAGLFADSPELATLRRAGLAVLGMAWDSNELSAGAFSESDTGLTDEGRKMVLRCLELGIVLDASHLSDRAFYEMLELSPMPHIATHSNFREVSYSKRNLTRDMALSIAKRGGVIGINLYPGFLNESGTATTDDILRQVDYGLELVGENSLGFGFDIDGTGGRLPIGIRADESIHEQVIELLLSRYPSSVVERIAGLNVIEFLQNNLL